MAKVGYCSGCGRYVELTARDVCPAAHPRAQLRDVHEGRLETAPIVGSRKTPAYDDGGGVLAQVIGKGIVLVPVGLIVGWGLWSGYEEFGPGMSVLAKLGWSIFSLALTVGLAFLWSGMHRRH